MAPRIVRALAQLLARRSIVAIAALLAFLLTATSLDDGLVQDDRFLELLARGEHLEGLEPRAPWDLFRFYSDTETVQRHRALGIAPWWVNDGFRVAFVRPIASLWHYVDFAVLRLPPWAIHLESIVLYALAAALIAILLRRLERSPAVAGLAAVAWAIDDAHGVPAGWIAQRNALIALVLGVCALLAHDTARRVRSRAWLAGAVLLFTLALASAEAAVGALAYVIAYAAALDRDSPRARLRSVLPYVVVLVLFRAFAAWGGYGASGSQFYLDPGRDPLGFLSALPSRVVALLVGQLGFPPSETAAVLPPEAQTVVVLAGALVLAPYAWMLRAEIRADRMARFALVGMVLSCLPLAATWPNDRLLLFTGIGGFLLVARLVRRAVVYVPQRRHPLGRLLIALTAGWVGLHFVLAPLLLPLRVSTMSALLGRHQARAAEELPRPDGTLLVVRAPDPFAVPFGMLQRVARRQPMPDRMLVLCTSLGELVVERPEERVLVLRSEAGLMRDPPSQVFLDPARPFAIGLRVQLPDATIEVIEAEAGVVRALRVELAFDPDPASSVAFGATRFEAFTMPPVGGRVTLPPIDMLEALSGE